MIDMSKVRANDIHTHAGEPCSRRADNGCSDPRPTTAIKDHLREDIIKSNAARLLGLA